MPATDSRVRNGKLTLTVGSDTIEVSCQVRNVAILPEVAGGDERIEVLCGDVLASAATANDVLHIDSIQDFTDPAGMQAFLWRHRGAAAQFVWQPTSDASVTWTGKVTILAPAVGGDVNAQLDYSLDMPILSLTPPTGFGTGQISSGGVVVIVGITEPTGGANEWLFSPSNATLPANLAAVKGHAVVGDQGSAKPSRDFTAGEYATLGDGAKAHYTGAGGWASGEMK